MGLNRKVVNSADDAIIAQRREMVARARLRGATQREIVIGLTLIGFINQKTGEPWSLATVHLDLKAIQADWRKEARQAIDQHKARQLAELQEARRQAWHDNDIPSVLRAVGMEMALIGTEAPKKQEITGKNGAPIEMALVKGYATVTPDDWDADKDKDTADSNL